MSRKDKDRSHLRLLNIKESIKEETQPPEYIQNRRQSIIKEKLKRRGLTLSAVLLPSLTMGFLACVSIFLLYILLL